MSRDGLPTGEGTADKNDVADPHPADEEDYDRIPRPGGAHPPKDEILRVNPGVHDGKAPPRPRNKGAGPQ